ATYEPLLAHIAEQDDLHDVMNMMIGELNASHTGVSGGGRGRAGGGLAGDQTRSPDFGLAPSEGDYKVTHIYRHRPPDRVYVKTKDGDYAVAVDGAALKAGDNYGKHCTTGPATRLELTVNSKPGKDGAWTTKVTPVSANQFGNLQYQKWVDDRRELVNKI